MVDEKNKRKPQTPVGPPDKVPPDRPPGDDKPEPLDGEVPIPPAPPNPPGGGG